MKHHWTFKNFHSEDLKDLKSVLAKRSREIETFLSYYFRGDGATVENLSLSDLQSPTDSKVGNAKFLFDVAYFNLCWNIDDKDPDKMDVELHYDKVNQELKLIGPDW